MSSSLSNDNNNEASSSSPASKDLLNAGQRSIAQRLGLETSPTADNKSKDIMDTEQLKNQPKTKPAISHINAPNDLLARVSAFLPQMQQANQTLFQQITQDPQQYDIEAVSEDDEYIEMNLGLGVLEAQQADQDELTPEIRLPGTNNKPSSSPPQIIMMKEEEEESEDESDESDSSDESSEEEGSDNEAMDVE